MGEIADVFRELFGQRPVEAEILANLGDRLRRRGRPGEIDRRIARQHTGQQKGDDDDPDQRWDHRHESLADGLQHCSTPLLGVMPAYAGTQ